MVGGLPRTARIGAFVLIVFVGLFMVVPLVVVAGASVSAGQFLSFPPDGFSLQWYSELVTSEVYLPAFRTSLIVAFVVAAVAGITGTMAALALTRFRFPGAAAILGFVMSPLIVPSIILAIGLLAFLSAYSGGPSIQGLIAGHTALAVPYVTRTVSGVLVQADPHIDEAARVMGARAWERYLLVILPQARSGIAAGLFFAFSISFDEAVVALFLQAPQLRTLPLAIYGQLEFSASPSVAAVSTVMVALSVVVVLMLERMLGLGRVFGDDG